MVDNAMLISGKYALQQLKGLRASEICPTPCAHPLLKSPLRASVTMAFLVARIGAQNDPCVHPFQE